MTKITLDKLAVMVQTGFNELTGRIDGLKKDVDELKQGQKALTDGIGEIHIKLDHRATDFDVKTLTRRVDRLERK